MTSKKPRSKTWTIFVDGASRNNPGPAGAGIAITLGDEEICKRGYFLGKKTNNQAEYLALLIGLLITKKEFASRKMSYPLLIISDSELLVKQIKGIYRVKNPQLAKIKEAVDTLLEDKTYTIKHVLREKNKVADELANKGIDTKRKLPLPFVAFLKEYRL